MRLYLDNSVYAFIDQCGERPDVARLLRAHGAIVTASVTNIIEAAAIPDHQSRAARARTLATIADEFEHPPSDYLEAQEVLSELRRCRPEWLRSRAHPTSTKRLLRARARQWQELKAGADPQGLIGGTYGRVLRPLSLAVLDQQRAVRRATLSGGTLEASIVLEDADLQAHVNALPALERYTRLISMNIWHRALNGAVELRDLKDWLIPYLRPMRVGGSDFERFWLRDANLTRLTRTGLAAALGYYQSDHRPTKGTLEDVNHGLHVLGCDLFLTSDVGLAGAMKAALRSMPVTAAGIPMLLDRAAPSVVREIEAILAAGGVGVPGQPHNDEMHLTSGRSHDRPPARR